MWSAREHLAPHRSAVRFVGATIASRHRQHDVVVVQEPTDNRPRPAPKIGTVLLLLVLILVGAAVVCLSVAALRRGRATEVRKDVDPGGSEREVYKRLYGKRSTTVGDPVPLERPPEADVDGSKSGLSEWAMSEENVALARRAIDALNRGDLDALVAFLSPDVAWEALEGVVGMAELYRGRAGVREWIELMWKNAEEGVHIEIEQITDLGDDRVFIAVLVTGRRRGSGVPFEYRTWQLVWFADRLITRRQVFWTRAEALKTAGLRG